MTHPSVSDYFDSIADKWDGWMDMDSINRRISAGLSRFGITAGECVLDVGCGTGNLTRKLLERLDESGRVMAVDVSPQMIELAKAKNPDPRSVFHVADVCCLPVEDRSLDRVLCFSMWPHVEEPEKALLEIKRVLKPGGFLHIWHIDSRETINHIHANAGRRGRQNACFNPGRRVIKTCNSCKSNGFNAGRFNRGIHCNRPESQRLTMSCNRFIEVWGSAQGPVKRLSLHVRLLIGVLLFSATLIADPASSGGLVLSLTIPAVWFLLVRPPKLLVGPLLSFAFILFIPFFLLTPWIESYSSASTSLIPMPWAVPWRIAIRGASTMCITAWTASALTLPELERSFKRLHVPRPLAMLLLQIIHQAHALAHETHGILQAVNVRGGLSGWRSMMALSTALPRVWLPRVLYRAERVGDAMEIRNYNYDLDRSKKGENNPSWAISDSLSTVFAVCILLGSVLIRWMETT